MNVLFIKYSNNRQAIILFFLFSLSIFLTCCNSNPQQVSEVSHLSPFEKLSEYNFFVGKIADLQPNERVLPYDLNSPLFSDYAHKSRSVWMPEGTSAKFTSTGKVLDFPTGTILIKTFFYQNDERDKSQGKRNIETRLLIKGKEKWEAHGYTWNEEQTDATLDIVGDIKTVNWIDKTGKPMMVDYIIPNKNQCKGCHYNKGLQEPIGPKIRNLNKEFAYLDGKMNQLEKWNSVGYLADYQPNTNYKKVAKWDNPNSGTLHERALAYLDINCGHCHNPNGPASTTGLNLVAEAEMNINLGINKPSVAAGAGTGGFALNIIPGHPEKSILTYRMSSIEPAAMMPELGRRMVHEEGLELIREWILKMEK
jgi:uncharacterized repeat protein (TIGR03806 family)